MVILNFTSTPASKFNNVQVEAIGLPITVIDLCHTRDLDVIEAAYDNYRDLVKYILVDSEDFVFATNIANLVDCPVRTLDVTIEFEPERNVHFSEWEYAENR